VIYNSYLFNRMTLSGDKLGIGKAREASMIFFFLLAVLGTSYLLGSHSTIVPHHSPRGFANCK
jgi:hypothetical protein